MTKARRVIAQNLGLVDCVLEVLDARIPDSSRNPDANALLGNKPRIVLLNKRDLADQNITRLWLERFPNAIAVNAADPKTVFVIESALINLFSEKIKKAKSKGVRAPRIRAMLVGVPNVGKSALINRLAKQKKTAVSDRPGVTRGKQWIKAGATLDLLDMPGVLWPKFDDQDVAIKLAITGAISDEVVDSQDLCRNLIKLLNIYAPEAMQKRYGANSLEEAAEKRKFLIKGGDLDLRRAAAVLLDEFRAGKLGRITLEKPKA